MCVAQLILWRCHAALGQHPRKARPRTVWPSAPTYCRLCRCGLWRTSGPAPCPGGFRPRSHHDCHHRAPETRLPAMRRTIDVGYVNGVPRVETHCCTIAGNPKCYAIDDSIPMPLWYFNVILVLVWRLSWSAVPAVLIAMVGDGSPPRSLRHSVGTALGCSCGPSH